MKILKGLFENSRFNICGNLNMLSFENFNSINSNVNYILMPTMTAFKDSTTNSIQRHNTGELNINENFVY